MSAVYPNNKTNHGKWCPGAELNHRHEDFQSSALPTELPGLKKSDKLFYQYFQLNIIINYFNMRIL